MRTFNNVYNPKTIDWLLEKENPSVRYFTLTGLLNKPFTDKNVIESKKAIFNKGIVACILEQQHEGGYWGDPGRFYNAKYTGTVWQLMILAELGADVSDERIKNACEFILNNAQEKESCGFSFRKHAKEPGGIKSEIIPCLTGNMVWSLVKLGLVDDKRVQGGIEWICNYQRTDDRTDKPPQGWPYDRYEMCWGRHSCHMGVVKSLKALAAIPDEKRNDAVKEKISQLAEFLLKHHIYKKSHDLSKTSRPGWLKPGFPLMYQTDILEILEILTDLGYHDPRIQGAIDIIKSKKNKEGRWILENTFNGKMLEDIEQKGKESKWITLKALKIISHYE